MKKKRRNKKNEEFDLLMEQDEHFYCIAGYTDGGIPYGVTWEEAKEEGWLDEQEIIPKTDEDFPF